MWAHQGPCNTLLVAWWVIGQNSPALQINVQRVIGIGEIKLYGNAKPNLLMGLPFNVQIRQKTACVAHA